MIPAHHSVSLPTRPAALHAQRIYPLLRYIQSAIPESSQVQTVFFSLLQIHNFLIINDQADKHSVVKFPCRKFHVIPPSSFKSECSFMYSLSNAEIPFSQFRFHFVSGRACSTYHTNVVLRRRKEYGARAFIFSSGAAEKERYSQGAFRNRSICFSHSSHTAWQSGKGILWNQLGKVSAWWKDTFLNAEQDDPSLMRRRLAYCFLTRSAYLLPLPRTAFWPSMASLKAFIWTSRTISQPVKRVTEWRRPIQGFRCPFLTMIPRHSYMNFSYWSAQPEMTNWLKGLNCIWMSSCFFVADRKRLHQSRLLLHILFKRIRPALRFPDGDKIACRTRMVWRRPASDKRKDAFVKASIHSRLPVAISHINEKHAEAVVYYWTIISSHQRMAPWHLSKCCWWSFYQKKPLSDRKGADKHT